MGEKEELVQQSMGPSLYDTILMTLPEYPLGYTWSLGVVMTDCDIVNLDYVRTSRRTAPQREDGKGNKMKGGHDPPAGHLARQVNNNKGHDDDPEDSGEAVVRVAQIYQEYFSYLDSLEGQIKYRWGDHAIRGLGMAVALRPLELRVNQSLTWEMGHVPYAHQSYCNCGGPDWECIKVWDAKWSLLLLSEEPAQNLGRHNMENAEHNMENADQNTALQSQHYTALRSWRKVLQHRFPRITWNKKLFTCIPKEH